MLSLFAATGSSRTLSRLIGVQIRNPRLTIAVLFVAAATWLQLGAVPTPQVLRGSIASAEIKARGWPYIAQIVVVDNSAPFAHEESYTSYDLLVFNICATSGMALVGYWGLIVMVLPRIQNFGKVDLLALSMSVAVSVSFLAGAFDSIVRTGVNFGFWGYEVTISDRTIWHQLIVGFLIAMSTYTLIVGALAISKRFASMWRKADLPSDAAG